MSSELVVGAQVRCLFGTGVLIALDRETKRATVKLNDGTTKFLNMHEIEQSAMQSVAQTKTVVTTTVTSSTSTTTTTKTTRN